MSCATIMHVAVSSVNCGLKVKPSAVIPSTVFLKSARPGVLRFGSSQKGWKKKEAKPSRTAFAYLALPIRSSAV